MAIIVNILDLLLLIKLFKVNLLLILILLAIGVSFLCGSKAQAWDGWQIDGYGVNGLRF